MGPDIYTGGGRYGLNYGGTQYPIHYSPIIKHTHIATHCRNKTNTKQSEVDSANASGTQALDTPWVIEPRSFAQTKKEL